MISPQGLFETADMGCFKARLFSCQRLFSGQRLFFPQRLFLPEAIFVPEAIWGFSGFLLFPCACISMTMPPHALCMHTQLHLSCFTAVVLVLVLCGVGGDGDGGGWWYW